MATPAIAVTAPDEGLTETEARRRLRASARRPVAKQSSRSYASIVRANVFTVFNLILARRRRAHARVRRLAGRALPRRARRELGDRDRAGGAREAGARPARGARRADGDRRPRRERATVAVERGRAGRPRARRSRATRSSPTGSSCARERPAARRVDPDGRVAAGRARRRATRCAPARSPSRARARYVVDRGRRRRATRRGSPARRARSAILARRSSARSTGCCSSLVAVIVPLGVVLGYALWERHTPLARRGADRRSPPSSRSCRRG